MSINGIIKIFIMFVLAMLFLNLSIFLFNCHNGWLNIMGFILLIVNFLGLVFGVSKIVEGEQNVE